MFLGYPSEEIFSSETFRAISAYICFHFDNEFIIGSITDQWSVLLNAMLMILLSPDNPRSSHSVSHFTNTMWGLRLHHMTIERKRERQREREREGCGLDILNVSVWLWGRAEGKKREGGEVKGEPPLLGTVL